MKFRILLFPLLLFFFITSCDNHGLSKKEKEDLDYYTKNDHSEFNSEKHCIAYRKVIKKDIICELNYYFDYNNVKIKDICISFYFFNYGDEIRLFRGMDNDYFINGLGKIQYAYVLNKEDHISINNKRENVKYGEWALATFSNEDVEVRDVFLTPLAYNAYQNGKIDELIFFQFVTDEKYMSVLFCGGPKECIAVSSFPHRIKIEEDPVLDINTLKGGPGQFWHDIIY